MAPVSISIRACSAAGKNRVQTASCSMTPRSSAAAYMARAVSPSFGKGLFAQHVLAGLDGEDAVLLMQRVDGSDIDDVDIRRFNHLGVAAVCRSDAVLLGELARAVN